MRANSSGVQSVRPALDCSFVDSAVSVLLTMARPASSGCTRMSLSWASRPASRSTCTSASFSAASVAKGRLCQAASAIQGECSYTPSSAAVKSACVAALSWASVSMASLPNERGVGVERVHLLPVPRDVDAARDPDAVVALDVVEELLQRAHAPGAAEQAAVHADGHHLGCVFAFGVEHVEAVAQIGEEVLALRIA